MTGARAIPEILADCLHIERLGHPVGIPFREDAMRRAANVIRLLARHGVQLARSSAPRLPEPPASDIIWRSKLFGGRDAERLIRRDATGWSIVAIERGVETIEQTFSLEAASINGGAVLIEDPAAKQIPGLGRRLAAALEIFRVAAETMEAPE